YAREDHVLDQDLPLFVAVPPIAEVQVALQQAMVKVTGLQGRELKTRMRTGTVATTDNRNWELRYDELFERLNQQRAIAVDMESATIAANGFRLRVPYGTLLCVSDKPLHGEIKLRGMANLFYEERINQHLQIGIEAIRILRDEVGPDQLHSRKLRSFDEPGIRWAGRRLSRRRPKAPCAAERTSAPRALRPGRLPHRHPGGAPLRTGGGARRARRAGRCT